MNYLKSFVVIWPTASHQYCGCLLEDSEISTVANTPEECVEQIRQYLLWLYKKDNCALSYLPFALESPQITEFAVTMRPEYLKEKRLYYFPTQVKFRVHCIHEQFTKEHGYAVLPIFGIGFHYHQSQELKFLAQQAVQRRLNSLAPHELIWYLPPSDISLASFTLKLPQQSIGLQAHQYSELLSQIADPLAHKSVVKGFGAVWERDDELTELVVKLTDKRQHILLMGPNGSGKSSLIAHAAYQIERNTLKEKGYRFWSSSAGRIVAGMKYLGQWEERLEEVLEELIQLKGILCFDSLSALINQGGSSPENSIAAFLKPYLEFGDVQIVIETTKEEYEACRNLLPGFLSNFIVMKLGILNEQKVMSIFSQLAQSFQKQYRISYTHQSLQLTYSLFKRFLPYRSFPGPAKLFLTQQFEKLRQYKEKELDEAVIIKAFSQKTGLPIHFLNDHHYLVYEEVVQFFSEKIIGQPQACRQVADIVCTFKAGLNPLERPIAVMLFAGPTGVGKTALSQTLAHYFFGQSEQHNQLLFRLDMSEYNGPFASQALVVNANQEPSPLIEKVRQQPFIVLLLDEIEKADNSVFDVLLSVFDEGRLSDQYGRVTIFQSAIIIMTSNLGSQQKVIGFGEKSVPAYDSVVKQFFKPEFFNRIDMVVPFQALDQAAIHAITIKELESVCKREGLMKNNLRLQWSTEVVQYLAKIGFDPLYGARPLQRVIEQNVITPVSHFLLKHPALQDEDLKLIIKSEGEIGIELIS